MSPGSLLKSESQTLAALRCFQFVGVYLFFTILQETFPKNEI